MQPGGTATATTSPSVLVPMPMGSLLRLLGAQAALMPLLQSHLHGTHAELDVVAGGSIVDGQGQHWEEERCR